MLVAVALPAGASMKLGAADNEVPGHLRAHERRPPGQAGPVGPAWEKIVDRRVSCRLRYVSVGVQALQKGRLGASGTSGRPSVRLRLRGRPPGGPSCPVRQHWAGPRCAGKPGYCLVGFAEASALTLESEVANITVLQTT